MAITTLQLDGQNIGFQLTGGSLTVDLFTIDVVTGEITSSYLSAEQIRNLKPVVDELFTLVPLADRAAGALGLLSRIVAVSAADSSTVTMSVVPAGPSSGTYRATVGGNPAYIIMHLPFSPDGNIAWGTGLDVVGTGTVTSVGTNSPIIGGPITTSGTLELVKGLYFIDSGAKSGAVTIAPSGAATAFVDTTIASSTITPSFNSVGWFKGASYTVAIYIAGDAVNTITLNNDPAATAAIQWLGGVAPAWYPGPNALGAGVNGVLFLTNIQNGASKLLLASWQVAA